MIVEGKLVGDFSGYFRLLFGPLEPSGIIRLPRFVQTPLDGDQGGL
jgi:hypothetical protein